MDRASRSAGRKEDRLMTEEIDKLVHFVVGVKFKRLQTPCLQSQVKCPDCDGNNGSAAIFEPKDGPERVWWCSDCKGQVPRSRHWKPRKPPHGMEREPVFMDADKPQFHFNLSEEQ